MNENEMKNINIIMPMEKEIILAGRKVTVKKLGFRQSIKLWNFVNSFKADAKEQIIKAAGKGDINLNALFENTLEEKLPELFGILLNSSDVEYLKTIDDLEEVSALFVALVEVGGFDNIVANFQKGAEKIGKLFQSIQMTK